MEQNQHELEHSESLREAYKKNRPPQCNNCEDRDNCEQNLGFVDGDSKGYIIELCRTVVCHRNVVRRDYIEGDACEDASVLNAVYHLTELYDAVKSKYGVIVDIPVPFSKDIWEATGGNGYYNYDHPHHPHTTRKLFKIELIATQPNINVKEYKKEIDKIYMVMATGKPHGKHIAKLYIVKNKKEAK